MKEQKLAECKEVFELFDRDKDGSISIHELGNILRSLGVNPTLSELQLMINEVDTDGPGKIEFDEFYELFGKQLKESNTEEDYIEAFKIFDKDGNGFISLEELCQVMKSIGENITEEDAKQMIKEADIDGDGYINYHEFVKIMISK